MGQEKENHIKLLKQHQKKTIAVIGPKAPPYGGMANQAQLLLQGLKRKNQKCMFLPTNNSTHLLEKLFGNIFGLRTTIRAATYYLRLIKACVRCDVFHIMACSNLYYFINVIPAAVIGHLSKKCVIINYRGGEADHFFKNKGRHFKWVLSLANRIVVPSKYLKSVFQSLNISSTIVPNIIDLDRCRFRYRNMDKEVVTFICTRQFEPYYDIFTLIKAFSYVKQEIHLSKLILIGDGSQYEQLKDLVWKLKLENNIDFKGKIKANEISNYLDQADIFVNASVVDNYPNSILEAFAVGLPVITTSAGGIPFLVNHLKNGIMVDPGDPNALSLAMIKLVRDKALCCRLAANGREIASQHSWDAVWKLLKEIYVYRPIGG